MQQRILQALESTQATYLDVQDESHLHSRGLETHFKAVVVSPLFDGLNAVKRHQRVTICNTPAPDALTPACASASTNWSTGWLIFADTNGNKVKDAHETLLHLQQALPPTVGLMLAHSKPAITFGGQGLAVANNASFLVQSLASSTPPSPPSQRCVRLAVSGRVRVLHGVC